MPIDEEGSTGDLLEQTRVRREWLAATAEIRADLLSGVPVEDALGLIAQRTLELTGSDATFIGLGPDPVDHHITIRSQRGPDEPDVVGRTLDGRDPVLREVLDGRVAVLTVSPGALLEAVDPGLREYGPMVAVPLRSQERVIGALFALRLRDGQRFLPSEVPLLTSFAEQAALALELAEKNRAQRLLDLLSDRDRIARDLHDHVIQRLFATGLQLQSTLYRTGDPAVRQRIQQAVDELDETVRVIRTSIFDLHTTGGGVDGGLRRTLLDTAAEAARGTGVSPSVRISGPVDTLVPPRVGVHARAVVREAVSNAVRHGRPGSVTLTVEAGDELLIEVVDDGLGIPAADGARSGLRNLEARARECGGELTVGRRASGGTRLTWRVPLSRASGGA